MSERKFITFMIEDRVMGLDILGVREIIKITNITAVQTAAPHIRG
jgi:chemotaxis signal transduction protein